MNGYFAQYIKPLLEHFADADSVEFSIHQDVMLFAAYMDRGLDVAAVRVWKKSDGAGDGFGIDDARGCVIGEYPTFAELLAALSEVA
ncbi:hypothetical protein [Cardiobacterium valvarum]|uniref:Uncharacterized protein n=1 Tax=Cardiobacterium valvarum TaxID=194702 RepID=A0A381EFA8_9GAMM|nr:hypothetical protein [Cardiobacterium valvarum]SUX25714.1 Uncharacterised protein [Cardiobacterium valvarum]